MDSRSAKKLIEKCFPEIRIGRVRQIHTGWENLVLEVNGEYVFRFPKFRETEWRLKFEIGLLPRLRRVLSTPIPEYQFVWKGDGEYPHWFGGYPKLEGITASDRTLSKEWTAKLAEQISRFLRELHSAKIHSRKLAIPTYSHEEWLKSTRSHYKKIRKIVYPLLRPNLRVRSNMLWEKLLVEFAEADFVPTLIHGDLGTENILFDPATLKLTGILDWGYTQVSDPALEFAHLYHHNVALGEEVLKRYGTLGLGFERRVQWYVKTEPFYDIMWGVAHHWKRAEKTGIANLVRVLTSI